MESSSQDQDQPYNPPPSHDERCTDLPFLLHALSHLEPRPQITRGRHRTYDQYEWHSHQRELLQVLTLISQLFSITPNTEVALTMYMLPNKAIIYFACTEAYGGIEEGYICVIGEMVKSIARGEYGRRIMRGRGRQEIMHMKVYEEMMIIVVGRCREKILWLFEKLAGEEWASGVSILDRCDEDGEGVGWEKVVGLATGETKMMDLKGSRRGKGGLDVEVVGRAEWVRARANKRRRLYCFPDDDVPVYQELTFRLSNCRNGSGMENARNENMARGGVNGNDNAHPRTSNVRFSRPAQRGEGAAEDEEAKRLIKGIRQGIISFLLAIRSEKFRETSNDELWEYMRVVDLICKKRERLEMVVRFTDEQLDWVNKISRYSRAVEFIIKRAFMPKYQKLLANLEIYEIIPYTPNPPDESIPPPQTTVLEILEWVERKHSKPPFRLLITPPSIKNKYPNADPRALWTPSPPLNRHSIHPEVAIINFIYNHSSRTFNTPFLVYGVSGLCCWACDLYAHIVNKEMLKARANGFFGRRVYKEGWTGIVPKGDGWYVPVESEGDRKFRQMVMWVIEESLRVIVGNTRKAWINRLLDR
ncbi:hypothetical protein TWF506_005707 [Arthrobotrys conoides]|uniref:Uncharacterized protein n=1 Tax=Arthrobotrys conoides TaxID=74498 RepID=A0AAN8NK75_9PEZI